MVVGLSLLAGKSYLTHDAAGVTFGPLLLHFAHQVTSEIPYLTFSLLALWLVDRGVRREGILQNGWLLGGMACTIWAFYIRTAGIALVAAVAAWLFLRRDFRRGLLFVGAAFVCWLPWMLRNQAAGGSGVYIKQLLMVNPYHPEQGWLDLPGLLERFLGNLDRYLRGWPEILVPSFGGTDTLLHPAPLLLIALAAAATVLCIRRGEHLLVLYAAFSMGMLLLWAWPGDRFLVPLLPVVILLGVSGRSCRSATDWRRWARPPTLRADCWCGDVWQRGSSPTRAASPAWPTTPTAAIRRTGSATTKPGSGSRPTPR